MSEGIKIITRFKSSDMTALDYINFSQKILEHLKLFHPIFRNIYSWGDTQASSIKITDDFSNYQKVVFEHIYDDELNYLNDEPSDKGFHLNSKSHLAFSSSYTNKEKEDSSSCSISISAGGNVAEQDELGHINIKLPRVNYPELNELDTIKQLISHLSEMIDFESVYVTTDDFSLKVIDFSTEYDTEIGWLNYFKDKKVSNYLSEDIPYKQVDKGIFFWLSDKITDPNDDFVQKAIRIRDNLAKAGLLNFT